MIDQRRLPGELAFVDAKTVDELCDAIRTLAVRGAPALGVAGAMGMALAQVTGADPDGAAAQILGTRPTAVNLAWGVGRGRAAADAVVDCVGVGADRIARNGDVANKVGTYSLAVLARHHGIPFYVAAPLATVDLDCPTGADIPIERRAADEVASIEGHAIAPPGFTVE